MRRRYPRLDEQDIAYAQLETADNMRTGTCKLSHIAKYESIPINLPHEYVST